MFNPAGLLANTKIDIYRPSIVKDTRGGQTQTLNKIYSTIDTKIESRLIDIPIQIEGASYNHTYLVHLWQIFDILDGDIIKDTSNNKKYKIVSVNQCGLFHSKFHKIECECIVLGDDRFTNYETHL